MKTKFCLDSVASFDQINRSVINQSPTKQTFSFSKGSRFEEPKPSCPRSTYGGDFLTKKALGTAIGYGKKSDFTHCLTVSPSADKYNLKSFWDENIAKKKGPSFGLNREKVSFNSYVSKQKILAPSPALYNNEKKSRERSPQFTMRPKTSLVDKTKTIQPQNDNPGPGSYINPQIQAMKSSKYIGKFQNISFSQSKSKRFAPSSTYVPGPGNYKQIQMMSKTGSYVLSQHRGGTKAKFDNNKRQTFFDQVYKKQLEKPAPGYYKAPSEFGQYDGNIYNELRQTKRSSNGWKMQTERSSKK